VEIILRSRLDKKVVANIYLVARIDSVLVNKEDKLTLHVEKQVYELTPEEVTGVIIELEEGE